MIHQIDSKNEWLLLPASFMAKFELAFVLTLEKVFLRGLILTPTERASVLLKNSTRDFQDSPPFERSACFYMTITQNLNVFNTLTLKQIFWKAKTFFEKLDYHFLVESSKIESASFSYKTPISEAKFKTNKIVTTK